MVDDTVGIYARSLCVGRSEQWSGCDAERLEVVMVGDIAGKARESIGDITGEAGGLAMMVCLVFSDFPIDVVGGEQGVCLRSGQGGYNSDMGDAMRIVLREEQGMMGKDTPIFRLFIGDDHEGSAGCWWAYDRDGIELIAESPADCTTLESGCRIEAHGSFFLDLTHGARAFS